MILQMCTSRYQHFKLLAELYCMLTNNLRILSKELEYKNSCKYLGVHIDKNLRFREHIDHVVKKLNKFCGLIYRVRHLYPSKCLLMFYNSFAKSIITYELLLYGTAYKTNMTKIEAVQRRIIRAIFSRKNSIPWKVCVLITKF